VTNEDISAGPEPNGLHHWAKEGIVGRGVLIDYAAYCHAHGIPITVFKNTPVTVAELTKAYEWQGLKQEDFWEGDILFVRFGYTEAYEALSEEERDWMQVEYIGVKAQQIGIAQGEDTLRWLWDMKFAAAAGDTRAFEVGGFLATEKGTYHLHPVCIAGWGMSLGEFFDLEALSKKCAELQRYTFFLTSEVLNVPGGVASPPNALAIF